MANTTVAHSAPLTTTNLNARAERALELYRTRGHEIERAAPDGPLYGPELHGAWLLLRPVRRRA